MWSDLMIRLNERGVSKKCASVWERMWSTTSYVVFFIFPFLPVCVCTGPAVSVCATHCRAQSAHKEKGAVRGGVEAKERVKLKKRKERAEGGGTVQCAEVCMSSEGFQLSQTIVGGKALCMTIGSLTPVKLAGGGGRQCEEEEGGCPHLSQRRECVHLYSALCGQNCVCLSSAFTYFSSCLWALLCISVFQKANASTLHTKCQLEFCCAIRFYRLMQYFFRFLFSMDI